jgi:hypothetical protein
VQGCAGEEVVHVGVTAGSLQVEFRNKYDLFGITFHEYVSLVQERRY